MNRSKKSLWLFGAALLVALCFQESGAFACSYECVKVAGPQPYCKRCLDTGSYTGVTCHNSGSCNCIYDQNSCGLFAAANPTEALQGAIFAPAEGPAAVSVLELTSVDAPGTKGPCDQVMFDPTSVPEGIETSDDPVLLIRPAAYAVSFSRRMEQ